MEHTRNTDADGVMYFSSWDGEWKFFRCPRDNNKEETDRMLWSFKMRAKIKRTKLTAHVESGWHFQRSEYGAPVTFAESIPT